MSIDSPYPELKKTHTMAHTGRPWKDFKPPPSGPVWSVITAGSVYWMLVAAIDLGIFDNLVPNSFKTSTEIADDLGLSAEYLEHLLDCMVTLDFLDQVNGRYSLTETAERYLCKDGAASMASLVRVSPGPLENWMNLAETIRAGKVKNPIETNIAGIYGPLVTATFPTQHRVATRLGFLLGWQRKSSLHVLDLGAGCAPWSIALMEQAEGSTATINDFPDIIPLAEAMVQKKGLFQRSIFRAGNFHDIEIEKGIYDIVFLGHICRTEGETLTQNLIERAANALKPGGQIIVADYYADNEKKLNAFGVHMGMTMLANTVNGSTVTFEQMYGYLAEQNFERVRVLEPIGYNMVFVGSKSS